MSRGVCIVTGGARGIGAAAALKAAADGWDILINYRANDDAAEEVAQKIKNMGRKAGLAKADVSQEEGILATFEAADAMGTLSAVITNAGVGDTVGTIDTFTYARVDRIVTLNLTAVIICCREAVKRMAQKFGGAGGSIINVSSAAAKLGGHGAFVDYAATKGAIDTLTVGLALEWVGEGIRVNAVRPGVIITDFHASVGVPNRPAEVGPGLPMARAGTAEEVAEAISWLMSDQSSYTTGAILEVSGGRSIVP